MGIHAAARTTKQWLRELFTPPCALRDAARAACVCRGFLHSWRCYTNLTLNVETLGLTGKTYKDADIFLRDSRVLINIVDKILRNHSRHGVEVSRLNLELYYCKNIDASYLDRWLQITAVRPGIKELKLVLCRSMKKEYIFPCSVLSNEAAASSIRKIICLKIPCTLQQLNVLTLSWCEGLQAVEINAPNLSTLHFLGTLVEISVAHPSQLQDVHLNVDIPVMPSKFPYLKKLKIDILRSLQGLLSLVSFLDASPALDSFTLHVGQDALRPDDFVVGGDNANYERWQPQRRHDCLRE
ncbi:hypothetical protein VPH35_041142 [Triticum aestivum]